VQYCGDVLKKYCKKKSYYYYYYYY